SLQSSNLKTLTSLSGQGVCLVAFGLIRWKRREPT
ncbi:unnamed protein product, partial [Prunus brigantina]